MFFIHLYYIGRAGDLWMVRVDSNGKQLWSSAESKPKAQGGFKVVGLDDGGFAMAMYERNLATSRYDSWIARFDASNKEVWKWSVAEDAISWSLSAITALPGGELIVLYVVPVNDDFAHAREVVAHWKKVGVL